MVLKLRLSLQTQSQTPKLMFLKREYLKYMYRVIMALNIKNGRLVSIDNPYAGEISFKWIDDDMVLMSMGTMRTDVLECQPHDNSMMNYRFSYE